MSTAPGALADRLGATVSIAVNAEPAIAEGRILVAMRKHGMRPDFAKALVNAGARSLGTLPQLGIDIAAVAPGTEHATIARLKLDRNVQFAEIDRLMPAAATVNDPTFASSWHLTRIHAPAAWDYTMGTGVIIAILDTGVDATHPDLAAQIVAGWNFYDNNADTSDVAGHGTAVAGAAAATTNNGIGVAAVAGGARIMPVRIASPSAFAYWSTAAQGIVYAADHGARVVNLSYAGAAGSGAIQTAAAYLRAKGGVLVVAAGNTGKVDTTPPTDLMLVVAATDESDALAGFSTYGDFVSLSAPGNNILSTLRGGNYVYWWGTSFAAPVVAGTAALVLAQRPDYTPAQVDATLKATAVDLGDAGPDARFGAGRIDAGAAVQFAAGSALPDTTPPAVAIAAPQGGAATGTMNVDVTASDAVGVARVDLQANGIAVASTTTFPFRFSWDTATVANGSATLTAVARDAAGNNATSAPVVFTVANAPPPDTAPPWVVLHNLGTGPVTGLFMVTASAGDNVGVARVDFRVNGVTVATTNTAPYGFAWATTTVPDGIASLVAIAFDAAGNSATSPVVQLAVSNPPPPGPGNTAPPQPPVTAIPPAPPVLTAPGNPASPPAIPSPSVAFLSPSGGALVTAVIPVATRISAGGDAPGVTQTLYIDGKVRHTATGRFLDFPWNARHIAPGPHTLAVVVRDASGVVATVSIQVLRK